MDSIADWLKENELIVNLKKGKTEILLFGTAKWRSMQSDPLKITISCQGPTAINITLYKYLGILIDGRLNLNPHFEKCFKRATGRLRLLAKLRDYLDIPSAKAIYRTMILPTFTYCGILQLKITQTQLNRLTSLHDWTLLVVFDGAGAGQDRPSVVAGNKIRACKLVRKCLDNDICDILKNYFTLQQHERETRNNKLILKLPSIKSEYAHKSFYFMSAKVYDDLPLKVRKIVNFSDFERKIYEHFNF